MFVCFHIEFPYTLFCYNSLLEFNIFFYLLEYSRQINVSSSGISGGLFLLSVFFFWYLAEILLWTWFLLCFFSYFLIAYAHCVCKIVHRNNFRVFLHLLLLVLECNSRSVTTVVEFQDLSSGAGLQPLQRIPAFVFALLWRCFSFWSQSKYRAVQQDVTLSVLDSSICLPRQLRLLRVLLSLSSMNSSFLESAIVFVSARHISMGLSSLESDPFIFYYHVSSLRSSHRFFFPSCPHGETQEKSYLTCYYQKQNPFLCCKK